MSTLLRSPGNDTSCAWRWKDVRAVQVQRAGGEEAVEAGEQELLAHVVGHRLAEVRRA